MSRTETLDNTKMTNGPITRILLSFAGPVLLGQLLQQIGFPIQIPGVSIK